LAERKLSLSFSSELSGKEIFIEHFRQKFVFGIAADFSTKRHRVATSLHLIEEQFAVRTAEKFRRQINCEVANISKTYVDAEMP